MSDAKPAGGAETRFLRATALALGFSALVFGGLGLTAIQNQIPAMSVWWSAAALALVFGLPIAMAIVAPWSSARAIRLWAATIAVAQLAVFITWVPFMTSPSLPAVASQPWVFGVTPIGSISAAMAWSVRGLWAYLPTMGLLVLVDRALTSPQPLAVVVDDALYAVMMSAIFASLVSVSISRGIELDTTAANAREAAAAEAMHRAEHRQRLRVNALMHDQVLVTLLVAGQASPRLQGAAAAQARRTLTQIEEFDSGQQAMMELQPRDLAWQLQAVATETDPAAEFSYEITPDAGVVDAEAARALGEGLTEALRNVLRHAAVPGAELHRAVHVLVSGAGANVDVLDDGRGFDPAAVDSTRLGLAVSIRARMATLPGGSSEIVSVPGRGTRIALRWVRP
jgi:signal transduction histidine kinase